MDKNKFTLYKICAAIITLGVVVFLFGSIVSTVSAERTAVITPGIQQISVTGSCYDNNANVASTTLFAVNPFFGIGTSTITFGNVSGIQGATTTDLAIGTSTIASIASTQTNIASLNANYLIAPAISTSTSFWFSMGSTRYPYTQGTTTTGTGLVSLNSSILIVGPNEKLVGYATSTYPGKGNGGLVSGTVSVPTSCTYKFIFSL